MVNLIDTHAHLDYEYDLSVPELLAEAKNHGVNTMIAIAAAAESLDRVKALAETYPNIYFSAGIHPHDAKDYSPEIAKKVAINAAHPRCVAIGELGLDYFYEHSDKETQFRALEEQMLFSAEIGKPIIVHTRDADSDTEHFLSLHAKAWQQKQSGKAPGVIHCFTGTQKLAEFALNLGYYISFSGILTFKNAEALREVAKHTVPLDKVLVETDSPYLAPIPHRGKKNHPAYTQFVAQKLAELKGLSLEEIAKITTNNATRLFSLPA